MIFTTTLLRKKFDANLLFTYTDSLLMKSNQKMFMKNFLNINICLI